MSLSWGQAAATVDTPASVTLPHREMSSAVSEAQRMDRKRRATSPTARQRRRLRVRSWGCAAAMAPTPASVTRVQPPMLSDVSRARPDATAHADTSRQPSRLRERSREQSVTTAEMPASEMRPQPLTSSSSRRWHCFESTSRALSEMSHQPRHRAVRSGQPCASWRTPMLVTSRQPSTLRPCRPGQPWARSAMAWSVTSSHCARLSRLNSRLSAAAAPTCASDTVAPRSSRVRTAGKRAASCASASSQSAWPRLTWDTRTVSTHESKVRFHSDDTHDAARRSRSGKKVARWAVESSSRRARLARLPSGAGANWSSHSMDSSPWSTETSVGAPDIASHSPAAAAIVPRVRRRGGMRAAGGSAR
mmetsp:Transcript_26124/g.76606  ORF Transcript_26124/g.76606 Transcript_26124/m.76606 type:complete len:362 (+) Transcript_26124:966-2051(+)